MSQVQRFYAGLNIFITGATGFLGKILTEKLLRSCPDIGTIYILIRAKKGKSAQQRIDALFADTVFQVLREEYPDFSKKIVGVTGDVTEEGLGLSSTDHERLINEVSVIFHLAATVRFNEKLDKAFAINVNGAKFIVDMARAFKNLKVLMYVSTAYSHCVQKSINEELYPTPMSYEELNKLVKDAEENKLSEDEIKSFEEKVIGKWPNTYSFTKAVAEGVIAEFAKDLPIAVFRPSIVMNAYREPIPGWLSGVMGLPGLLCGAGLAIIHTQRVDVRLKVDIVPVDYVCNALITSAWEVATTKRRHAEDNSEDITVYNYVSGNQNPVIAEKFYQRVDQFGRLYPTNKAVYYPYGFVVSSSQAFTVLHFFLHLIPAIIVDNIAKLFGKQLGLYESVGKLENALHSLAYFSTRQWDFENKRIQNLWKRTDLMDKQIFPFNIQNVDWDEHMLKTIKGLRKYILGDTDDNLEQARRRHFYFWIIHTIVRLLFGLFVLWIILKFFNLFSSTIATETFAG